MLNESSIATGGGPLECRRGTTGSAIEPGAPDAMSGPRFACGIGLIIAIGATLRFVALDVHSFWFDEVVAIRVSQAADLREMVRRLGTMDKVNAPLHPLLLMAWTSLWGTSESAARSLSALFSALTLLAFPWTAWQATRSKRITTAATALFAVCPLDLRHAVENRMYSMLSLWTVLAWGLLLSFRRDRSIPREVALTLCLVALAYTHPLGGLMVIALALGYALDRRHSRLTWPRWLAIQTVAFLAILPWASRYLDHPPDPKLNLGRASLLYGWIAQGLGLPINLLPAVVGLAAVGWWSPPRPIGGRGGGAADGRGDRARTALILICWLAAPVLLMAAYTLLRHPILGPMRYHANQIPAVVLLAAGALDWRPRASGAALLCLTAAYTLPSLWAQVYDPQIKPDWREATRRILRRSPDPVIVLGAVEPHMYYDTVDYYLPPELPAISLETYRRRLAAGAIDRSRACWLLHDLLDGGEKYLETLAPERIAAPEIALGRLRVLRLDPALAARLGAGPPAVTLRR